MERRRSPQLSSAIELGGASRTEDAVVADFRRTLGQDVLKKPVDKLRCGKLDVADLVGLVVTVAETNDAIVERLQAAVDNGDSENVAGQIVEHFVAPAGVLRVNDPANLPDGGWSESKQSCLFESGAKLGAKDDRQCRIGNQEEWVLGISPGLPILSETSGGDEHVDVRMKQHGPRPGVKNGQRADAGAEE